MVKISEAKENENQSQAVFHTINYQPSIVSLKYEKEIITAQLDDGRMVSIPVAWFPALRKASSEQLNNFQIAFDGQDVTWSELDADISVRSFTHGLGGSCC